MKHALSLFLLLLLVLPLQAENWMKRLPDDAYVATLSIPGSHDTGTGNGFPGITTSIYGPFGNQYARTQDKNLEEQWNMGVRAFDLRPCIKDNYINVNHGIMPTNLRFDDALYFFRDKLIENPSEFVIIHLLHASDGDDNASNYGERLLELLNRDDLKDFFVKLYDVEASHEMLAQLLWIAWVRKRDGADQLLHDLLDRSVKAQLSLIRYFTKEIVNMYPAYVRPVTEWVVDSEDEELGKAYDYLIDDFEDRPWEEIVSFVDTYTKGKVFRYASHQFLDFMKEKAAMHPDDVLRWMCVYAEVEHKDEQNLFHASTTMGILVSAYNAIRKYDKSNQGLETALDTMDKLMAMESVRRGMRRFLYELDNR